MTTGREVYGGTTTDVIFDRPDTTGAMQCVCCGGWIVSSLTYYTINDGPWCPSCWAKISKEDDEGESVIHPD